MGRLKLFLSVVVFFLCVNLLYSQPADPDDPNPSDPPVGGGEGIPLDEDYQILLIIGGVFVGASLTYKLYEKKVQNKTINSN